MQTVQRQAVRTSNQLVKSLSKMAISSKKIPSADCRQTLLAELLNTLFQRFYYACGQNNSRLKHLHNRPLLSDVNSFTLKIGKKQEKVLTRA